MGNFRIATAGAMALSALVYGGATANAETVTGLYLAYAPGKSVEYLSLVDAGRDTAVGYLAAVRATGSVQAIASRTQIFSKRVGNTLLFGNYCATRTADGFMLTSIMQDGGILQEHFIRSTVESVNASIVALQESASPRLASVRSSRNAQVSHGIPLSGSNSAQLWTAQAEISAAQAQLSDAQDAAIHLRAAATLSRAMANAAVDEPGVSFMQNRSRMEAMKQADDAEQNAVAGEHRLNVAEAAVANAKEHIEQVRSHVASAATTTAPVRPPSSDRVGP